VNFTDVSQANNGGAISTWSWDFGDPVSGVLNFSSLQNPQHIYRSFGQFTVNQIVTNVNGCKDTATHVLYLHDTPFVDFAADTACLGDSTHFADLSSPPDSLIAWQWTFGDGATSNLQSPAHEYAAAGVYTVTLSVTNQSNCGHDTTKQVLVRPVPQALFSASNNCQGLVTQFNDQSYTPEGVLVTWAWDFGDGQTSTLPSPVHLYATYGTYTVTLTVTNSYGCSGFYSKNVVIYRNPTADFSFQNSFCPAGVVSFSDHTTPYGTTLTNWEWVFEPGQGSNVPNPVHTFAVTDTTYDVTLISTDANGCIDTVVKPVNVKPGFDFTFNIVLGCTGSSTEFIPQNLAAGDSITAVSWTFGDPASGSANYSNDYIGVHAYQNTGNYIVKMKAWNSDLCVDSIVKSINIRKGPSASFTYPNTPHCDSTVKFVNRYLANGLVIDTIQWIFPDTLITDVPPFMDTVTHKFSGFGIFQVTQLVHASNGCTGSYSKDVTVSCISAGFTVSSPPRCSGQLISFSDKSGPSSLISNWNWDFGDGTDTVYTKFASVIRHRYLGSGNFTVRLVVTSVSGVYSIRDTLVQQVSVSLSPGSSFSVQGVCFGDTSSFVNLTDTTLTQITSYRWTFGEPSSGANNQSSLAFPWHKYSKAGKYTVTLISRNQEGCQDTAVKKAVVHKLPQAAFTTTKLCARDIVQFSDATKIGDTVITAWYWDLGDTHNKKDTSFLPDPTHVYDWPGNYGVYMKVDDYFGCSDTTLKLISVRPTPISAFNVIKDYGGKAGQLGFSNLSKDATRYYWIFGNGETSDLENPPPVLYEDDNITYTIRLIAGNAQSCNDTTFYEYSFTFHGLYVPNAFSPDNESQAVREFKPQGINLASYHLVVYDNGGHLLFESRELDSTGAPLKGWDGNDMNGQPVPQGTYMWKISAVFTDGTNWEGSDNGKGMGSTMGTVALIR
jgi:PKD repeat protein